MWTRQAVGAHAFKSSTLRQRQADLCEFEASLVYRGSSRTARATLRNPGSKRKKMVKEKNAYKLFGKCIESKVNSSFTAF